MLQIICVVLAMHIILNIADPQVHFQLGGNYGDEDDETYEKCTSNDCRNKEACATIYQYDNFKGWYQCHTFEKNECVTLNKWWIGEGSRVSSVGTDGSCVRVYIDPGCNGDSMEIKPSVNLGTLGRFDEKVTSISACKRPLNQLCSVRDLFSSKIEAENVLDATTEMLSTIDQIASIAVSGFSAFIPGLDLFYDGLKFLTGMFDSDKATEALIDAKIDAAFAKNSASQISAKVHTINNRLIAVLSNYTPAADRRIELGVALNTCEEVAKLFEDDNYSFSQNKLISSPYLVGFSSVYLSVAKLIYQIRPDLRIRIVTDMMNLKNINMLYMSEAGKKRKEKFETELNRFKNGFPSYAIEDRLICEKKSRSISEKFQPDDCYVYGTCVKLEDCENCMKKINKSIDHETEDFFRPVISKLAKFPG